MGREAASSRLSGCIARACLFPRLVLAPNLAAPKNNLLRPEKLFLRRLCLPRSRPTLHPKPGGIKNRIRFARQVRDSSLQIFPQDKVESDAFTAEPRPARSQAGLKAPFSRVIAWVAYHQKVRLCSCSILSDLS